jgi:hypothetical protein
LQNSGYLVGRYDLELAATPVIRIIHTARIHKALFAFQVLGDLRWVGLAVCDRFLYRDQRQVEFRRE